LIRLINYLKRSKKRPITPNEPYDRPQKGYGISFGDAIKICDVLEKVSTDAMIVHFIIVLVDDISSSRSNLSREQKQTVVQRLSKIIEEQLPDKNNIQHDGYKILCQIRLFKLERKQKQTEVEWRNFLDAALRLNNIHDQIFVLIDLGEQLQSTPLKELKQEIREIIINKIETVPVTYEKAAIYCIFANSLDNTEKRYALEILEKVMTETRNTNRDSDSIRKQALNIAHTIDPSYCNVLIERFDDDPVRVAEKRHLEKALEELNVKDEFSNQQLNQAELELPQYQKEALRRLKKLNGKYMRPVSLNDENIKMFIQKGSLMTMSEAYVIWAWIIQNSSLKYSGKNNMYTSLKSIYESTIFAAEMTLKLASIVERKTSGTWTRISSTIYSETDDKSQVFDINDREEFLTYLEEWFSENPCKCVKICDPYFCIDELDIVKLISDAVPDIEIMILTSLQQQKTILGSVLYHEAYEDHWKQISTDPLPKLRVQVVGFGEGEDSPIHDRWILTDQNKGLSLGTSLNGFGKKISMISQLDNTRDYEDRVDKFIYGRVGNIDGVKIKYLSFQL